MRRDETGDSIELIQIRMQIIISVNTQLFDVAHAKLNMNKN